MKNSLCSEVSKLDRVVHVASNVSSQICRKNLELVWESETVSIERKRVHGLKTQDHLAIVQLEKNVTSLERIREHSRNRMYHLESVPIIFSIFLWLNQGSNKRTGVYSKNKQTNKKGFFCGTFLSLTQFWEFWSIFYIEKLLFLKNLQTKEFQGEHLSSR